LAGVKDAFQSDFSCILKLILITVELIVSGEPADLMLGVTFGYTNNIVVNMVISGYIKSFFS